jgi:hypothetical protein
VYEFTGLICATVKVDQGKPWYFNKSEDYFMVEVEKDNTKAIAGTALGFGIGSAALNLLGGCGNGLGGLLGGWNNCGNGCGGQMVNRYEAGQSARIAGWRPRSSCVMPISTPSVRSASCVTTLTASSTVSMLSCASRPW